MGFCFCEMGLREFWIWRRGCEEGALGLRV